MRLFTPTIVLSACLAFGCSSALADDSLTLRSASSYFQRGDKALQSGDVRKAESLFKKALDALPVFPEAHLGLGHIAMREAQFQRALNEYEAARDGYREVSGMVHAHELEQYRNAQRQIRELEDQIRVINDPALHISESTRKMKTLQLESAMQSLRALEFPENGDAHEPPAEYHFHIGNALFRLDRLEDSIREWERCAARNPRFALVHNNLAVAYMQAGRLREARDSLDRARSFGLEINPALQADLEARLADAGLSAKSTAASSGEKQEQ